MQLAGGGLFLGAVSNAVDDQRTRAADAFAAIVIKGDRSPPRYDQFLVDLVEHLEKRAVLADVVGLIDLHPAFAVLIFLAPYAKCEVHL